MAEKKFCGATKVSITNDTSSVTFPCPNCGKEEIIRSGQARKIVAKYKCSKCGFTGPN